jgi:hypothetical protein
MFGINVYLSQRLFWEEEFKMSKINEFEMWVQAQNLHKKDQAQLDRVLEYIQNNDWVVTKKGAVNPSPKEEEKVVEEPSELEKLVTERDKAKLVYEIVSYQVATQEISQPAKTEEKKNAKDKE